VSASDLLVACGLGRDSGVKLLMLDGLTGGKR